MMSATVIDEKRQTTLPPEVVQAAGLQVNDRVDWRFEGGEIRGRKVVPRSTERLIVGKLVKRGNSLVLEAEGVSVDPKAIAQAVREERNGR